MYVNAWVWDEESQPEPFGLPLFFALTSNHACTQPANEKHPALLAAWGVKVALCGAFVLFNWGEPVAVVPHKNALWPLGGTLVFPHTALRAMGGAVTAVPWVALSDRASAAALRALAPAI